MTDLCGDSDAAANIPRATAVRSPHLFDQVALAQYLKGVLPDFDGLLTVTQFASGQSNPTFLLSTAQHKYVLRKKPPGDLLPSAHQIEREYKVMAALQKTGVAVPEVLHLCQDASVIGTKFFVMRYIEGRIFSVPSLPGLSKAERASIYDAASAMLARLHSVDIEKAGLSGYGRKEAFVVRQLTRWAKQYQASKTDQIDEMDRVIEWLSANIPDSDQSGANATLVHGDYRLDNMIFDKTRPEILAVLDWELSTLGNPLSDLGYFSMLYHLPNDTPGLPGLSGVTPGQLGIPTEQEFVQAYRRHLSPPSLMSGTTDGGGSSAEHGYFVVFSLFRLAAIAQGVYARARQGSASAANAEAVGRMARPCAILAWNLIEEIKSGVCYKNA